MSWLPSAQASPPSAMPTPAFSGNRISEPAIPISSPRSSRVSYKVQQPRTLSARRTSRTFTQLLAQNSGNFPMQGIPANALQVQHPLIGLNQVAAPVPAQALLQAQPPAQPQALFPAQASVPAQALTEAQASVEAEAQAPVEAEAQASSS